MKITIDTKEDSSADIRKVIALLSKMIEDSSEHHSNIFEDDSPSLGSSESDSSPTNAFASMFGSSDSDSPTLPTPPSTEDDEETEEEAEEETEEEAEEEAEEETPQITEY